jgi:photosystem II stability/assembly factor-like uncharacterized protein
MNCRFTFILWILFTISCKSQVDANQTSVESSVFKNVSIDTLFEDKISIRSLVVDGTKIWYVADKNRYGYFDLVTNKKTESRVLKDTLQLEFRSNAQTIDYVYVLSVSNPALLYQISKKDLSSKLVYQENHEKVFFDSMQFWNNKKGIAMGDPVSTGLNVIVTRDGGASWGKVPDALMPKTSLGEAAFAASNTNIVVKGSSTWIVSGGVKSRVFYSPNKGKSWTVYETPIVQGKSMTGIFTADFYDEKIGFISGGDYENRDQNHSNKAITVDGGKTWKLVAENVAFGYASCVQYVPNSKGKGIVTVGYSGIFYSGDGGISWKQLATDSKLNTIRFINATTAVAAGQNKMIRLRFNK